MTLRVSIHLPSRGAAPAARRAQGAPIAASPEPAIMTLGGVALWVALVVGLQQLSHRVLGMTTLDAWAFAVAILFYVALFTGFVIGLVYMVRREEASYSDQGR
jgi:hypothetical protein